MFRGLSVNPISVRVIMYIKLVVSWCAAFSFPSRNYLVLSLRISSGGGGGGGNLTRSEPSLLERAEGEGVAQDKSLLELELCATPVRKTWRFFRKYWRRGMTVYTTCQVGKLNECLIHFKRNKATMLIYANRNWICRTPGTCDL